MKLIFTNDLDKWECIMRGFGSLKVDRGKYELRVSDGKDISLFVNKFSEQLVRGRKYDYTWIMDQFYLNQVQKILLRDVSEQVFECDNDCIEYIINQR